VLRSFGTPFQLQDIIRLLTERLEWSINMMSLLQCVTAILILSRFQAQRLEMLVQEGEPNIIIGVGASIEGGIKQVSICLHGNLSELSNTGRFCRVIVNQGKNQPTQIGFWVVSTVRETEDLVFALENHRCPKLAEFFVF
jgi:hypothetical protein